MKHPAGYAPRRLAQPKKQAQLDLRRRSIPEPEDDKEVEQKSSFWKWVGLVALAHLVVFCIIALVYERAPAPTPPPQQFMDLLPPGDVVHGTPGTQEAPKVGPTTPAPSAHQPTPPPEPAPPVPPEPTPPVAVQPPPPPTPTPIPKPVEPPPVVIKTQAPSLVPDKPVIPKPAPVKPKVKVDLTLADGPAPAVTKPKPHHPKKPKPVVVPPDNTANAPDQDTASDPDNSGLSKAEIAARLGDKLKAAGIADSSNSGPSGSTHSQANPFQDFYNSIGNQVLDKWISPNLNLEITVDPQILIHVENDGRVPAESVTLIRSSGNQVYDDSALAAARQIGYTLQPLPNGCPPDITITFKPNR